MAKKMKAQKKLGWNRSNTVHRKPLDIRVQLDSYCQRGGETSNFTEIFDKDHLSQIGYPAYITSASSYLAWQRRFSKDINYYPPNGTDYYQEIPVQSNTVEEEDRAQLFIQWAHHY